MIRTFSAADFALGVLGTYINFFNACPAFPAFAGGGRGAQACGMAWQRSVHPPARQPLGTGCPVPSLLQTTSTCGFFSSSCPSAPAAESGLWRLHH